MLDWFYTIGLVPFNCSLICDYLIKLKMLFQFDGWMPWISHFLSPWPCDPFMIIVHDWNSFPFKLISVIEHVTFDALFSFVLIHNNYLVMCLHEPLRLQVLFKLLSYFDYCLSFGLVLFEDTMPLDCFRHDSWVLTCIVSSLMPRIIWYHPPIACHMSPHSMKM